MNEVFALILTGAAAITTIGCAGEAEPSDEAAEAEAASQNDASALTEHRGYKIATARLNKLLDDIQASDAQRDEAHG